MEITKTIIPAGVKLIINGRITSANALEFQKELEQTISEGSKNIYLNMLRVDHLSSAGIKVILKAYKDARKNGGKVIIEGPSESVRNVLGMTALDSMLIG